MKLIVLPLLLTMGLSAAPRVIDGLALKGNALLGAYHGTLADESDLDMQQCLNEMVCGEARLWAAASATLAKRDPDAIPDWALTAQKWDRISRRGVVDSPALIALLWLEHRWVDRHEFYAGEQSSAALRWRKSTRASIDFLTRIVADDEAHLARFQADREDDGAEDRPLKSSHDDGQPPPEFYDWQAHDLEIAAAAKAQEDAKKSPIQRAVEANHEDASAARDALAIAKITEQYRAMQSKRSQ